MSNYLTHEASRLTARVLHPDVERVHEQRSIISAGAVISKHGNVHVRRERNTGVTNGSYQHIVDVELYLGLGETNNDLELVKRGRRRSSGNVRCRCGNRCRVARVHYPVRT